MSEKEKQDIEREIELAGMMVKDLKSLWKSYAKKALVAKQERELKLAKKGFLEYETEDELIESYGGGYISDETYYRGIQYFTDLKKPPELSIIELHRAEIKDILGKWEGTVKELKEELNPQLKQPQEDIFARMKREKREENYKVLLANEEIA